MLDCSAHDSRYVRPVPDRQFQQLFTRFQRRPIEQSSMIKPVAVRRPQWHWATGATQWQGRNCAAGLWPVTRTSPRGGPVAPPPAVFVQRPRPPSRVPGPRSRTGRPRRATPTADADRAGRSGRPGGRVHRYCGSARPRARLPRRGPGGGAGRRIDIVICIVSGCRITPLIYMT